MFVCIFEVTKRVWIVSVDFVLLFLFGGIVPIEREILRGTNQAEATTSLGVPFINSFSFFCCRFAFVCAYKSRCCVCVHMI